MGSLPDSKYIIQTDGYWFVEAHDVDPSKGYITVSAKGVINGLSNQPNDGADFGPDSYNPNYTGSGIPYTSTSGIQEAYEYNIVNLQGKDTVIVLIANQTFTIDSEINFTKIAPVSGALEQSVDIYSVGRLGSTIEPSSTFSGNYLFSLGSISFGMYNLSIIGNSSIGLFENPNATSGYPFDYHWYNCYFSGSTDMFNLNSTYPSARYQFWDCQFVPNGASYGSFNSNGSNNTTPVIFNGCDFSISSGHHGFEFGACSAYFIGNYSHITNGLSPSPLINTTNSTAMPTLFITGHQFIDTDSAFLLYFGSTNTGVITNFYLYGSNWNNNSQSFIEGYYTDAITSVHSDMIHDNSGVTVGLLKYIPVTTPSVPTSGTAQQNTNPYPVNVYIYGGTVTVIDYTPNGGSATQVGTAGPATVRLNPGDSITLTYSAAPTWNWVAV